MKEEDPMTDALLKDLWTDIRELGFFVVGIELNVIIEYHSTSNELIL